MQKVNDQVISKSVVKRLKAQKGDEEQNLGVPSGKVTKDNSLKAAPNKDVSPTEIEEFMRSLACNKFEIDPHSRFCETCGYLRSEHRAPKQEK